MDRTSSLFAYWDLELICRFANPAYEAHVGSGALTGKSLAAVLGAEAYARDEAYFRAALAGTEQRFEQLRVSSDGTSSRARVLVTPDVVDGEVVGVIAQVAEASQQPLDGPSYFGDGSVRGAARLFRDLSAQQRAVSEAERAEESFRLVVEAAPAGMLMVDGARVIRMASQRAEALFGYERGELVGLPIETLVPIKARTAHPEHVASYLAQPSMRAMGAGRDLFGRRKDGAEVPVEIGLNPIETTEGRFTLAAVIDITERKAQQDELRRSNAELEHFAYIASHDLQEPLRMVASFTELLSQRYKGQLDEKADRYIFYAVDGARRMQQLVADLLAYSRVGSQGKPLVPVSSASTVERVLKVLHAKIAETGASIEASELPTVMADDGQLQQLFQNLLSNALKFRSESPPVIRVAAKLKRTRWLFTVSDNGIGFDTRHAERLFQMFQRLHERGKYEGSGIGLAVAKRILERHGGRIWVDSTLGEGTTFYFTMKPVPSDAVVVLPEDSEDELPLDE